MATRWAKAQERWRLDEEGWLHDNAPELEEPVVIRLYNKCREKLGSEVQVVATIADAKRFAKGERGVVHMQGGE